ncbi:MAG: cation:proton antiporter [Sulfurimonadaceae bacterium]|jgi:Kef-type K+ transport system membrane component KefB|nr:cation:proton antiporter [Sulfurimonadaceae bacterium]
MSDTVLLILTISLIIVFSPFFAKKLKLPTTPIEIILGSVFTYVGLIHNEHLFEVVAEFGFLYLMFIAGTEINMKKLLKMPWEKMRTILVYVTLLYVLSISIALYFELGKIFMVLLPLISVGLIATLSKEYGKAPWLTMSMNAGAIGEVVSIAFLTLTSAIITVGYGFEFAKTLLLLFLFLLFMFLLFKMVQILFWWFPEVSLVLMPYNDNKEQDLRLSMGIFFLLLAAMLYLDLELAFGAFLAGIFIPTFFEHKQELPEKLASFGFGFLIPIFFIYIGSSFNLEALMMDGLIAKAVLITVAMTSIRVLSSLVFIKELGFRDAILMGLSHSMPLTLLIAMATLAYQGQSIDTLHYYSFILAALFQVLSVMILIKFLNRQTPDKVV